jgi:hypothetical protein
MAACLLCARCQFGDEVFSLSGHAQVSGMWRMYCETTGRNREDWKLSYNA